MAEVMKRDGERRSVIDKLNKMKRSMAIEKRILSVTQPTSPTKTANATHTGNFSIRSMHNSICPRQTSRH